MAGDALYAATGNEYRGEFRSLREGWGGAAVCLALVEFEREDVEWVHLRGCAFLDACSHAEIIDLVPRVQGRSWRSHHEGGRGAQGRCPRGGGLSDRQRRRGLVVLIDFDKKSRQ